MRVAILALAIGGVGGGAWAGPDPALGLTEAERAWLEAHPEIRLGPYSNYPPAQFVDEHGEHRGIAAEYVARLEEMLEIEFVNVYTRTWQEILDRTRAREIDVIAMAAETTDRTAYLSFTRPYIHLPAVIIARDSVDRRLEPGDLSGMRVAVVAGYAVQDYLRQEHPELVLDPVPDTRTGLRKVSLGMADAFVSDLAVASHYIDEEGIPNLQVVGDSGFVYRMGFACRSDWPQLHGILEKALALITPAEREAIEDRWIRLSREPEFASQGLLKLLVGSLGVVALLAAGAIVWHRWRAVRALEESERRTRLIIATALDAVITMDAGGTVTGWSDQAERTFGWTRDEAMGRSLSNLIIPPQHRDAHRRGLARFLETGEGPVLNTRIEITGLHKDGREIDVELAIAPIERGGSFEFSAFVRDITQRKQAEAELERHRHRLEELVVERTAELRSAKDAAEQAERRLAARVTELAEALAEVRQLRGLLPICSYCRRIREGEEYKRSVEAYLAEHHEAQLSHGVCPECYEKHVRPQLESL